MSAIEFPKFTASCVITQDQFIGTHSSDLVAVEIDSKAKSVAVTASGETVSKQTVTLNTDGVATSTQTASTIAFDAATLRRTSRAIRNCARMSLDTPKTKRSLRSLATKLDAIAAARPKSSEAHAKNWPTPKNLPDPVPVFEGRRANLYA